MIKTKGKGQDASHCVKCEVAYPQYFYAVHQLETTAAVVSRLKLPTPPLSSSRLHLIASKARARWITSASVIDKIEREILRLEQDYGVLGAQPPSILNWGLRACLFI